MRQRRGTGHLQSDSRRGRPCPHPSPTDAQELALSDQAQTTGAAFLMGHRGTANPPHPGPPGPEVGLGPLQQQQQQQPKALEPRVPRRP